MSNAKINRVVLLSGCSRGIGRAAAVEFARRGWQVVAKMRNPNPAQGWAEDHRIDLLSLDVTESNSIESAIARILTKYGRLDALINNAGYALMGCLEGMTDAEIRQQFDTNVLGLIGLTRASLTAFQRIDERPDECYVVDIPFRSVEATGAIIPCLGVRSQVGRPRWLRPRCFGVNNDEVFSIGFSGPSDFSLREQCCTSHAMQHDHQGKWFCLFVGWRNVQKITAVEAAAVPKNAAMELFELTVRVTNVKHTDGQLLVAVFSDEAGFPKELDQAVEVAKSLPTKPELIFKNLPAGDYAVVVVHDRNRNNLVDRNLVGMPSEPIGLSNYKTICLTNRPIFSKAK